MNGTWAVEQIERRDSAEPLPIASPIGSPFFPLAIDQLVAIRDGVARGYDDLPLLENLGGVPPQRYTNVASGSSFVLDMATAWETSCASTLALRAAFQPVDDDTMIGFVDVRYTTDCVPSFLDNGPNGLFAVRLARVAVPAATIGGSDLR